MGEINGASSTYTYDGSGLRVNKTLGGNTTTYVYDAFGDLAAEYSSQAATSACDTNTCYPILDHLGSTRMLTDAKGSSTVTRYDYLPFGQELLASTNGRTTGMGYLGSPDGSNPKFTGKNRDNESGFDWFEVRHMSGAQGRFQSVDPGNAGAQPEDPQTWNAYSYVGNNPLSYTDPSGQGFWSGFLTFLVGFFGGNIYPPVGSWFPNIGDVNSGPWNEQIPYNLGGGGTLNTGGVYGSGSTGPFIFDYNSGVHQTMTWAAAVAAGMSWIDAVKFSVAVVGVDFRPSLKISQGTDAAHAHWHAMGGLTSNGHETCAAAYAGAVSTLREATQRAQAGDQDAAALAIHEIQDSYASGHQYQWWPGGTPSGAHELGDATLNQQPVNASARYLRALRGNTPMQSPESYLFRPTNCR